MENIPFKKSSNSSFPVCLAPDCFCLKPSQLPFFVKATCCFFCRPGRCPSVAEICEVQKLAFAVS